MIKLLRIEFKKIRTYKTFWILSGLYFLFLALGLMMAEFMLNHMIDNINKHTPIPFPHIKIYFFPWVWQNMAFFATIRFVLIFPAIVMIILITNEFTFKTIRQNVITGMSKLEFLSSKLLIILLISIIMTIFLVIGTFILGFSNTSEISLAVIIDKISFIPGFFLTMVCLQIFAMFFGFLMRNTGLSIALFTLYLLIAEPVLYYFLKSPFIFKNDISTYLPANAILRITEYPAIPVLKQVMGITMQETVTPAACAVAILYSAVFLGMVYLFLEKRDL